MGFGVSDSGFLGLGFSGYTVFGVPGFKVQGFLDGVSGFELAVWGFVFGVRAFRGFVFGVRGSGLGIGIRVQGFAVRGFAVRVRGLVFRFWVGFLMFRVSPFGVFQFGFEVLG